MQDRLYFIKITVKTCPQLRSQRSQQVAGTSEALDELKRRTSSVVLVDENEKVWQRVV
jgi:hypothetical protein